MAGIVGFDRDCSWRSQIDSLSLAFAAILSRMLDPKAACQDIEKVEIEKLQIESLVRAKDSAAQKYEELVVSFSAWQARPKDELPSAKRGTKEALGKDSHIISGRIGLCIAAVERHTDSIVITAKYWLDKRLLQYRTIESSMADMGRNFQELTSCAKQQGIFSTSGCGMSSKYSGFNQSVVDPVTSVHAQHPFIPSTSARDLHTYDR